MNKQKKYVTTNQKLEFLLRKIMQKSPISVADLTELFIREMNMRASTARSSASSIVNNLIDYGVLDYVGTQQRGSKMVDLSPAGFIILLDAIITKEVKTNLSTNDLKNYLIRKGMTKLIPLFELYVKLTKEIGRQTVSNEYDEEIEGTLSDYLEFLIPETLVDDITRWSDVEEYLINKITELIRKQFLERPGGIVDLLTFIKGLTNDEKTAFMKTLYALKSKIQEEQIKLERLNKNVADLISKLESI